MVWLHDVCYTIPLYHQKLFLGEDARTGMRPNLAVYEIGLLLGVLMNQAEVGFMLQMLPADTEYKQIWLV